MAEWLQWFQTSLAGFSTEPVEVLAFAQSGSFLCQFLGVEYATLCWPCLGLSESVVEARGRGGNVTDHLG